jgi:hypothetical protein
VGAPAHRAPTTIASYMICPPAARLRLDPERVQLAGKDVIDSTKERIEIVVYSEKASRECVVPTARQLRAQLPGTFGSNEPFLREAKTIRLEQPRSNDAWMDGEDLNAPITDLCGKTLTEPDQSGLGHGRRDDRWKGSGA